MINKNVFSILCAILVWMFGITLYLLSYYIPVLENTELQSNIVLALGIVPSAVLGTYLFYRKHHKSPSILALTFVSVAILLDALLTVPVFIIPNGGSYSDFFSDSMFYTIIVEYYFIVFYFGNHLTRKKIKA